MQSDQMDQRLVGAWRLMSLQIEMHDTGAISEPWGASPQGYLVITPDGRLITVATASERTIPKTADDAADLLRTMVCYSGITRSDGVGRFVTDVDAAWHPSWYGTRQARNFSIDGAALAVRTDLLHHPAYPDHLICFILRWEREAAHEGRCP